MKICILSANLGNFDKPVGIVDQDPPSTGDEIVYHCFTDEDFPPIADLPARFQYRIPKMFGWQMFQNCDVYIWLDGSMSLQRADSVRWLLEQLGEADIAFFKHPWRKTVKEEVDHIEEYLKKGNDYITKRYKNGLHKEAYLDMTSNGHKDSFLLASTVFVYRDNSRVKEALSKWWTAQSRYYSCDQVVLPWVLSRSKAKLNIIDEDVFNNPYVSITSKHK